MDLGEDIVDALKAALIKAATREVMDYLVAKIPFFATRFINPIVGLVVSRVLEIAVKYTILGARLVYIDRTAMQQAKEFEEAARKNMEAQANGTPEQRKAAEDEVIRRARILVRMSV